jgi:uncharacterized hydrophobic protein (TIGR00271 family)
MIGAEVGRGDEASGTATLCFRTEAQARALVAMAAAIGEALPGSVELLYCRPGISVSGGLEPWLDELIGELCSSHGPEPSLRAVDLDRGALLFDLALRPDRTVFLATDPDDREATAWSYRMLTDSQTGAVLLRGAWPQGVQRVLLGAEAGATRVAAKEFAACVASATGADVVAVATAPAHMRAAGAIRQLDRIADTARSLLDVQTYHSMVPSRSRETALLSACKVEAPDLVVAGVHRGGLAGEFAAARVPHRLLKRCAPPLVLVNAPVRPGLQRVAAAAGRLFDVLPTLPAAERARIYSQVRRSARGDTDFVFMIVAAASLSALGLRLDSAVVIIGAMLVAPLMSPIVAVGLAVAQGDGKLLGMASRSVMRGTVLALAAAFLLGLLLPAGEVTGEMAKRANPSALDLVVAVVSGCAGAYALSRKGVSSSLPGVAIAVSLVPPLATAGVAIAMGEQAVASGSFLLFLVNLAAVATASGVVFVWMGFSPEADHIGRRRTFGKGVAGLGVMLVAVTVPLTWSALQPGHGTEIDAGVEAALAEAGEAFEHLEVLSIEAAREDAVLTLSATIEADGPLAQSDIDAIHARLAAAAEEPVRLTIRTQSTARAAGE